jgi:alpha-L-rhamnosidase
LHPTGWTEPNFRPTGWTPVAVIGPPGTKPFTHLVAQRSRIVEHRVRPVSVRTLPSGAVVADYGEVIAARLAVQFDQGVSGRVVNMHVGYALDRDGQVSTTHATQATDLSFRYIERAGAQTFQAYTYLGFRYLQIDKPGEPLTAAQLVVRARHAEMPDENAAMFSSTFPLLDQVWELVRHSGLYATQEQFVDTPTREKGQFLADSYNISLADMHAFRDQNMTWQALQDFAQSQTRYWPDGNLNAVYPNGDGRRAFLDFTERYPDWVWQYYTQTGDRATLAHLYPFVRRVAAYVDSLVSARTGLIAYDPNSDSADLVDWPPAMQYGYDTGAPVHTTANALAVLVFRRTAQMAALLGLRNDVALERTRRDHLIAAINQRLTRADGVYIDGLHVDGSQSPHASQQANAFALVAGVVPAARVRTVADYIASMGIRTGPMDGLFLLDALRIGGRADEVVRILTDARHPGWAYVVAQGGTFTWESWILSDFEGDSMSHGWGSSALVAFQTAILGVSLEPPGPVPSGPVVDVVLPAPRPTRLEGTIPTIAGPVTVLWLRTGHALSLRLTVPPNATARVHLGGPARVLGAGTYQLNA